MPATKTGYYTIYKATSPSGKIYIGFTHYRLSDRIGQHFMEAERGTKRPFCNALRKYGNEIKWEIICSYQNMEFALNREAYFINKFDTYNSTNGYNCTKGGEGCPGAVYPSRRMKIIDNHGNIYLGVAEVVEKLNISYSTVVSAVRHNYWCKGYYFSKFKDGMNKALNPKTTPKRQRKVINLHTGVTFNSIRQAAKSVNTTEQDIQRVCSGRRNVAKGQHFCYLEDKEKRLIKLQKPISNKFSKKVINSKGVIFDTLSEAGRSVNCSCNEILVGIKNKSLVRNESFCYFKQGMDFCSVYLTKRTKAIRCITNNKVYISAVQAAKDLNIKPDSITKVCKNKLKKYRGYEFQYEAGGGL